MHTFFCFIFNLNTFTAKPTQEEEEQGVETTTMLVTIAPTEEAMTTLPPDSGDLLYNKLLRTSITNLFISCSVFTIIYKELAKLLSQYDFFSFCLFRFMFD